MHHNIRFCRMYVILKNASNIICTARYIIMYKTMPGHCSIPFSLFCSRYFQSLMTLTAQSEADSGLYHCEMFTVQGLTKSNSAVITVDPKKYYGNNNKYRWAHFSQV